MEQLEKLYSAVARDLKTVSEQLESTQEKSGKDTLNGQRIALEGTLKRIEMMIDESEGTEETEEGKT